MVKVASHPLHPMGVEAPVQDAEAYPYYGWFGFIREDARLVKLREV